MEYNLVRPCINVYCSMKSYINKSQLRTHYYYLLGTCAQLTLEAYLQKKIGIMLQFVHIRKLF